MTTPRRFEQDLPAHLADLYLAGTPDYRDDIVRRTARMRQRPAWTFPERWLPMDLVTQAVPGARLPWRQLGVLALIGLLLAALLVAYIGARQQRLPAPFGPAANGLIPYSQGGDIYVGDPDTGSTLLVLGGPEQDWGASYSADGTWIGFIRDSGPVVFDIYVMRPDGSELRRLTPEPISDVSWVQWAPDSRHIAAIRPVAPQADASCAVSCDLNELVLYDVAGDAPVETIATAKGMDYVQFRPPDAGELMYRALVDGKWGLFAMDPDGANVRTLAEPTVPADVGLSFSSATYSADGGRIFYEHGDESGCCRLWVMDADGTDPHEFLPLGPAWDGQAIVSPDGTRVAYWHNLNDGPAAHGITVVRTDGTGPVIETGPKLSATAHWIWSPDSSRILLYPNDGSSTSAYLLDPDGGPYTTVPWESGGDLDWQRIAP